MTGPARRIGIYAINLDRAADRWADIRRWFEPMGFALHRVPGLDARSEPEAVLAFRGLVPILPPSGVGWTRHRGRLFSLGEEACFCGHLKAFGQFLAGDDDLALVLEDDAQPVGELAAFLDALARSDFAFDIIKLEGIRHHGARAAVEDARFAGGRGGARDAAVLGLGGLSDHPRGGAAAAGPGGPAALPLRRLPAVAATDRLPGVAGFALADPPERPRHHPGPDRKPGPRAHPQHPGLVRDGPRASRALAAGDLGPRPGRSPGPDPAAEARAMVRPDPSPAAGYSGTPLPRKLGFKAGQAVAFVELPEALAALADCEAFAVAERAETAAELRGGPPRDVIHAFYRRAQEMRAALDGLRAAIKPDGAIWISWPKKAAKIATDVTEDVIRAEALARGLVDVKVCAVNEVWSGLKLVIPLAQRSRD